jgi:endoribonuclease Dicer
MLKKLHAYIFKTIFNFNNYDLNYVESKFGGLIVILKKLNNDVYDINWSYMREIIENINLTAYDYLLKTNNIDEISNQIVQIVYPNEPNHRRPYKLNSVCKDLTPLSPFPTQKYKNYREYHEKTYKLETKHDIQNLVELKSIDTSINLIQTNIKKFKGSSKFRILFISEHIKILGIKLDAYNQLRLIPSSLYRINSMLNVAKLKIQIESDHHFIKLHEKIKQPKFEELSWNKSIKFHKIKEDEQEKQKKKKNEDFLYDDEEFNNIEIPDEIDEKLNEMIIEICSKAHKECYESSVDMSSSLTDDNDKMSIDGDDDDDELFSNNDDYDQDPLINDLTEKLDDFIMLDPVPKFLIIENQVTKDKIPSNDENNVQEFPNVYEILQCLTLKSSNDSFDLERYEILGDCFLKLNTSLYIYCMFKGTNEGNLTFLKSQRVSNRYLYKLAAKTGLNNYVLGDGFRVHDNWLPPNFCLKPVDGNTETKSCIIQSISDKSLADCIEALLGVYLIKCGTGAARAFLTWLDFIISKDETLKTDFTKLIELPNPLLTDIGLDRKSIQLKFASFESNIGYKFRDIIYVFQAFTHPSYMSNRYTGSYQRLEFIGDAVLDLLVTQYLFNDEKEHSPGELTDLRQALVNNKFFAHLSIKHNFHKYLSYESKNMFGELDSYIKMQKKYTPKNAYFNSRLVILISSQSPPFYFSFMA